MIDMKDKLVSVYEDCGCLVFILVFLLVLGVAFGIFCFEGWLFMLIWNALAAGMFGAPTIGYWVSVGVVWLLNLIGRMFTIKVNRD